MTEIEALRQPGRLNRLQNFAFVVFTLGIVGTEFRARPAGSAAYALARREVAYGSLETNGGEAYATILLATMIGGGMNFSSISPTSAMGAVIKDRHRT